MLPIVLWKKYTSMTAYIIPAITTTTATDTTVYGLMMFADCQIAK
jgi:hypothetical protein